MELQGYIIPGIRCLTHSCAVGTVTTFAQWLLGKQQMCDLLWLIMRRYDETPVQTANNVSIDAARLILIHICVHVPWLSPTWRHHTHCWAEWQEDSLCKRVRFVSNFLRLYKQLPASTLWLSRIRERRTCGLIYFPRERGKCGERVGRNRKQGVLVNTLQYFECVCHLIAQRYKSCWSMWEEMVWRWDGNKERREGVSQRSRAL